MDNLLEETKKVLASHSKTLMEVSMIECPNCVVGRLVLSRDALITYTIQLNSVTNEYYLTKTETNHFDTSEVWCQKCLASSEYDKRLEEIYNQLGE